MDSVHWEILAYRIAIGKTFETRNGYMCIFTFYFIINYSASALLIMALYKLYHCSVLYCDSWWSWSLTTRNPLMSRVLLRPEPSNIKSVQKSRFFGLLKCIKTTRLRKSIHSDFRRYFNGSLYVQL